MCYARAADAPGRYLVALSCAGSRISTAATYMAQPPMRLGSGAALKGVGNCSLVVPLTKWGAGEVRSGVEDLFDHAGMPRLHGCLKVG
jgi:hypothetical protein